MCLNKLLFGVADSTADPSIQEKQRLLKRARLQDSLSERLAHRPGPLELVERNILAEPELKDAVQGIHERIFMPQ